MTTVHGDDFTTNGAADQLDWFEGAVAERYEITVGPRIGPGPQDAKEATVLNRVVRWITTDDGKHAIEYEADPRQTERLVADCGLDGCKTVATPGTRSSGEELDADKPLEARLHTPFRGAAARGNYLSADRLDCQFACKEVCRWMANPTDLS